ncbi:MAG: inorganic phosphate transporter [Simkaniaceae bacterium]|nr:inorganic phosphate transporter [Simkaniaceae bacterium]
MGIDTLLLILVLIAGFYMSWNIGANDVSNAMGTSVGSGALTLFKAVILASVLEFCGAFFLGSNVSETVQKGIVNPLVFENHQTDLVYGMLASLISTALWLQLSSYFGWPVSTTHAIIGALLGFGCVVGGVEAVYWGEVGKIATSWVISPIFSGIFAYLIFTVLQRKILFAMNPIQATKRFLPYLVAIVLMTFTLSVLLKGLGGLVVPFDVKTTLLIALGIGFIGFLIATLLMKKRVKETDTLPNVSHHVYSYNKALKHLNRVKLSSYGEQREKLASLLHEVRALSENARSSTGFYQRSSDFNVVEKLFTILQLLSAAYVAFAHGANDVANAIGPMAAAIDVLRNGSLSMSSVVPRWLLALGGIGIVIGLATWGWRVMETIGKKITELTPTRGFSAEFGAAITILIASKLGLPISTTHCIVGAVLGVGLARGLSALNLRMLREIFLSWIITIPCSAIVCILLYYLLKVLLPTS